MLACARAGPGVEVEVPVLAGGAAADLALGRHGEPALDPVPLYRLRRRRHHDTGL